MSTHEPIRVLVVDDSALMRKLLADLLASSEGIEVVGLAKDGTQALALAASLKPDVVTLDVEMPGRSGLDILPELIAARPVPVLMVSSLTQDGAETTLAALALGAVDYLPKPSSHQFAQMRAARDLLVAKVRAAARCRVHRPRRASDSSATFTPVPRKPAPSGRPIACAVVGISTGGPQALEFLMPLLKPPLPPIVIVQHMPAAFTGVFARRLERNCPVAVREAQEGDRALPNQILIAPGGRHLSLVGTPSTARVALSDEPPVSGHRPSIDVLFRSAARTFAAGCVGILMTGMGRDGVEGCKAILAAGGITHGQDEETSVVYGMNKAAWVESALTRQFPLAEFPDLLRS